eukprot:2910075-Amphidinium_carterae.1
MWLQCSKSEVFWVLVGWASITRSHSKLPRRQSIRNRELPNALKLAPLPIMVAIQAPDKGLIQGVYGLSRSHHQTRQRGAVSCKPDTLINNPQDKHNDYP